MRRRGYGRRPKKRRVRDTLLETVLGEDQIRRPRLRRPSVICTAATGGHTQLLEIGLPTLRAYAKRHRFDLVTVTHDTAFGRAATWGKLPIIYRLLQSYEVVVWLDADTIVVDPSRNIAEELRPDKDIYLVELYHELGGRVPNAGVMMFRAGACAESLILRAWQRTDLVDRNWRDNGAIAELLGYRVEPLPWLRTHTTAWSERTRYLDLCWNSMPYFVPSFAPVINHYGGQPLEIRRARMFADLRRMQAEGSFGRVFRWRTLARASARQGSGVAVRRRR